MIDWFKFNSVTVNLDKFLAPCSKKKHFSSTDLCSLYEIG